MAAALTENACDCIETVPVILVLKAVFLCGPKQRTREQTAIGDAFDRFGVVPRGILPMFPRWFDRSSLLWDFWDLCCDGPDLCNQPTRRREQIPEFYKRSLLETEGRSGISSQVLTESEGHLWSVASLM